MVDTDWGRGSTKRVLLFERKGSTSAIALSDVLSAGGYVVFVADEVDVACQLINEFHFELIAMNVFMLDEAAGTLIGTVKKQGIRTFVVTGSHCSSSTTMNLHSDWATALVSQVVDIESATSAEANSSPG
jgi:DNA-binding NtrC family response regulator